MTEQANKLDPYVGPRPFQRKEGELFFGRRLEVNDMISLITAYQVVLLYAQSGAGKTSLLKASLLPQLEEEENFQVLDPARVRMQGTPEVEPAAIKNIFIFNALSYWNKDGLSQSELAQMSLTDFLKWHRQSEGSADPSPLVIVFDQFEELFTHHLDRWEDREDFFSQVSKALEADTQLRVFFVMREDYIAELDPYAQILPGKLRTRFRMERLRRANALEAIKEPLEAPSVKHERRQFAEGVAEALVDDLLKIRVQTADGEKEVLGQFVEPVQLQVVCQTLWQELKPTDKLITFAHLKAFGDVNQALTKFYETVIKKAAAVSGVSEWALRRWYDRTLITPDGKRGTVARGTDQTAGIPNTAIDVFEAERLIRSEPRDGRLWYELSQDRLIGPIQNSYKKWLAEQPGDEQTRLRLENQAQTWARTREKSLLLNEGQLLVAKRWIETEASTGSYGESLYALVEASEAEIARTERERERALAEEQRLRAEAELQRADALEQKTIEQGRRARQLRYGLALLCLLLLVMGGITGIAFEQRAIAQAQRTEAQAQQAEANRQRLAAEEATRQAKAAQAQTEIALAETQRAKDEAEAARNTESQLRQVAQKAGRRTMVALEQERVAKAELNRQRQEAVNAAKEAKESEGKAKTSEKLAFANQLTAEAISVGAQQARFLPNSVLLASESIQLNPSTPSISAYEALSNGLALLARPLPELNRKGKLSGIAFSPDGKYILTIGSEVRVDDSGQEATGPGSLWVWDAATGAQVQEGYPANLKGSIAAIAQSPDRRYLAALNSEDKKIIVLGWDGNGLHTEAEVEAPTSPSNPFEPTNPDTFNVTSFAISSERKYLAMGKHKEEQFSQLAAQSETQPTGNNYVSIWDWSLNKEVKQLRQDTIIKKVEFSRTGKLLATVDESGAVRVWRLNENAPKAETLKDIQGAVSIAFSPDDNYLAVGDASGVVRILYSLDWSTGRIFASVRHENSVQALAFNDDGTLLATASSDDTGRVWDWNKSQPREVARVAQDESVSSIVFSPDGRYIATATGKSARAWEVPGKPGTLRVDLASGQGYARSSDDQYLATAGEAAIYVWALKDGRLLYSIPVLTHNLYHAVINKDGSLVAATKGYAFSGEDETVLVWERSGSQVKEIKFEQGKKRVYDLLFSPDGRHLAIVRDEGTFKGSIEIKDLRSQQKPVVISYTDSVATASFSADGRYLAANGSDGIFVWDASSGDRIAYVKGVSNGYLATLSRTGKYLVAVASSSPDGRPADTRAEVWELPSGRHLASLQHDGTVIHLDISENEKYLATASADYKAYVWSLPDGKLMKTMNHADKVEYVAFSRDGQYLATTSDDNTSRVWKVETGCEIARVSEAKAENPSDSLNPFEPTSPGRVGLFAFFNHDGDYLITGSSQEAQMRVWQQDELQNRVCQYVTRNLSAEEWYNKYFINRELPETCKDLPQDKYRSEPTPSTCSLGAENK